MKLNTINEHCCGIRSDFGFALKMDSKRAKKHAHTQTHTNTHIPYMLYALKQRTGHKYTNPLAYRVYVWLKQ